MKILPLSIILSLFIINNLAAQAKNNTSVHPENFNQDKYVKCIEVSRDLIKEFMSITGIPGFSFAIDIDNTIVWNEGFGYSNLETGTKVDSNTKFRIASLSKLITGSLLGKLWDEGKIDLDLPIKSYSDNIPESWSPITLQHLAEHSSGIPHYKDVEDALDITEYKTTESALKKFSTLPLLHEPGKSKTYSSYAYTGIAYVLEQIFHKPFVSLAKEVLFVPIGMNNTMPDHQSKLITNRSGFYQFTDNGKVENAPYINLSGRWAGSGFLSTTRDLALFGAKHYQGSGFLSSRALNRITSIRDIGETKLNEGLGWGPRKGFEDRDMYFGDGSTPGATGGLLVYPHQKVTVSLLTNIRSAPINRGELQSIAQAFVLASEGKNIADIPSQFKGKYQLEFQIGGQKLEAILELQQTSPARGTLEIVGLQKFHLAGGFSSGKELWIYCLSNGRDPISLGILPLKISIENGGIIGEAFRINAKINGQKLQ